MDQPIVEVDLIVTKHPGVVDCMYERGGASGLVQGDGFLVRMVPGVPVKSSVSESEVRGKTVLGTLPLHLACHAKLVVTLPVFWRGKGRTLELEDVRPHAARPVCYRTEKLDGRGLWESGVDGLQVAV